MKLCGFDAALEAPLFLIAGPCVVESEQLQIDVAGQLKEVCVALRILFIFKSSYDKANRSSGASYRGPGMAEGLRVLAEVKRQIGVPVLTDEGFRETDFGAWEGLTFAEVRERWPSEVTTWLADPSVAPPGGESFTQVSERVTAALHRILAERAHLTVLIVSHVTPIKTLVAAALLAPPAALYRMHLDVAALCEIDWYADGPAVLRSFNDTAHLNH